VSQIESAEGLATCHHTGKFAGIGKRVSGIIGTPLILRSLPLAAGTRHVPARWQVPTTCHLATPFRVASGTWRMVNQDNPCLNY
jgi:hypothetical protein